MVFEKKLIILSGERRAKGTLTLERNAYGMFAALNLYNLPDLTGGEYCVGIRSGDQFELKRLGSKGRILERFPVPLNDLSCVHCVIFDASAEIPLLYGTNTTAKLWHANQMDGFRNRVDEKSRSELTHELPSYSGRTRDVKDYFFDIIPGDRIEVPAQPVESLPPSEPIQREPMPKKAPQDAEPVDEPSRAPQQKQSDSLKTDAEKDAPVQPGNDNAKHEPVRTEPSRIPQPSQESIEQSASSLLESARSLTAQYNDSALAETNYYDGSVTYSSLADIDPTEAFNPIDRALRDSAQKPSVQSVRSATQDAGATRSLKGATDEKNAFYTGETAFTVAPVSAYTASASAAKTRPQCVFFEQIKAQMDALFAEGERFALLEGLMEDTRWVRVNYDDKRFYAVGLVGSRPDYICYAVPAAFTPTPPQELGEMCRWMPENPSMPKGNGFWLMFQDATTGEAV